MAEELVLHHSGEIVDLDDAVQCARALSEIRTLEQNLRELKTELTQAIVAEGRRQGTKTIQVDDGLNAVLSGGTETHWDIETLEQLLVVGLPQDRYDALVRTEISFKVNEREALRIGGANPEYARIIAAAKTQYDKPVYVSFKRR